MLKTRHTVVVYLFDIDGTLLLSGGAGSRALDRAFAEHWGFEHATRRLDPGGKTDPVIVGEMFAEHLARSPTDSEIDIILNTYLVYLRDEIVRSPNFRLMPGVRETLDFLREQPGVRLGIATGNVREGAQIKLERGGVAEYFHFGGYGDDSADRAQLVRRAAERAAVPEPTSCVVVGDTPRDVQAARACSMRVIAVATGQANRSQLQAAGPDFLLDSLHDLPALHRELSGG